MINNPENPHDELGQSLISADFEPGSIRAISSEKLFAGHREVLITHEDKTYRLRITSQSKLVLNL